jgi:hypothetical protein
MFSKIIVIWDVVYVVLHLNTNKESLRIEAAGLSKVLVCASQIAWHHIPTDCNLIFTNGRTSESKTLCLLPVSCQFLAWLIFFNHIDGGDLFHWYVR